jgi:hypothetical protein
MSKNKNKSFGGKSNKMLRPFPSKQVHRQKVPFLATDVPGTGNRDTV